MDKQRKDWYPQKNHESVLLETAMELLGPNDPEDVNRDYGDNVAEARNYLSDKIAEKLGLGEVELPPSFYGKNNG